MTTIVNTTTDSSAVATTFGLAFSISPAKHKPKSKHDEDDEEYILTLAPFTKPPKINFGQVKLNQQVERNLLIINPQQFEVKLNISNQDLKINNMEITINANTNIDFKIKWQPDKPDNYKYSILFEVTNCARLKFLVHAFGVCLPDNKKMPRKPLTMLQPLKDKKATQPVLKSVSNNDKNNTTASTNKVEVKLVTNKENIKKQGAAPINKPSIRIDKTFTTTSSSSATLTTTHRARTLLIGPPQPSAARVAEKKRQQWANKFYNLGDENNENIEDISDVTTVFNNLDTQSHIVSDIRRQTTIISSPKLVKRGFFYSTDHIINENDHEYYHDNNPSHLDPSTPYLSRSVSSSNLSFIDKTVVFVAGTHGGSGQNLDDIVYSVNSTINNDVTQIDMKMATSSTSENLAAIASSRDSPTISSTLKKSNINSYLNANTPKYVHHSTQYQRSSDVSVTPKLSDFVKAPSIPAYICQAPDLESTKIAGTRLIDITAVESIKLEIINNTSSLPVQEYIIQKWSNLNIIEFKRAERYITMIQKQWRMKQFRRKLRELRYIKTQETIHSIIEASRDIANDLKLAENEQEEIIRREKEKNELNLKLIEQARNEREILFKKCLIKCQRIIRMKLFRKNLKELKRKEEEKRMEKLINCVKMVQMKWNYIKFRKNLVLLKQKENEYRESLLKSALICQRLWRMKLFRRALQQLKELREKQIQEYNKKVYYVIILQKSIRMKLFRINLKNLIQQREDFFKLQNTVIKCQKWFRYKKFCQSLKKLKEEKIAQRNEAATKIQKFYRMFKFRCQMKLYKCSVLKIQNWYFNQMKERRYYLKLRSTTIKIQQIYKLKYQIKIKSVIQIQSCVRMYLAQKKFKLIRASAIKIQKWFRNKKDRIRYLKLKRSLPYIQKKSIDYLQKINEAATKIQKTFRIYKFRESMKKYRQSAIKIQRWHREMFLRYDFIKKKRIILQIQALYRRLYMVRRNSAALRIQSGWRAYLARKELAKLKQEYEKKIAEELEKRRLNIAATKIQSLWRGYSIRKETNLMLNKIRNRLSFYMANRNSSEQKQNTLGSRIIKSLQILKYPNILIQQLMSALIELDKVTKLSPECCEIFSKEGAIEILYAFISSCNRSVPHMDLIKICLQIFINLGKYSLTCQRILEPPPALTILTNLLQAYQTSNPAIFMSVCVLFILLVQDESIKSHLLNNDLFIKKLIQIHSILDRRANLRMRNNQQNQSTTSSNIPKEQILNTTVVISTNNANTNKSSSHILLFTIAPEWNLVKKQNVELIEPIGALNYLLNVLEIDPNQISLTGSSSNLQNLDTVSTKTPKKFSQVKEKSSTLKKSEENVSAKKLKNQINAINNLTAMASSGVAIHIKQSSTRKSKASLKLRLDHLGIQQSEKINNATMLISNDLTDGHNDDDHISICSNESYRSTTSNTTIKSIASFHSDKPQMNSTSIMQPSFSTLRSNIISNSISSSSKIVKKQTNSLSKNKLQ